MNVLTISPVEEVSLPQSKKNAMTLDSHPAWEVRKPLSVVLDVGSRLHAYAKVVNRRLVSHPFRIHKTCHHNLKIT